ncbi:hypothetical protein [[Micrococcus luteus] ATCC 49442]|uniref:hypothetical protein n=1 Tax=[Micrococcus luteus] ATCC 49442 TaxID=2698727 RepID=UPI001AD7ADC8|nr:hypothetical protein [[Micrococcus luteus] ATCC 49442]
MLTESQDEEQIIARVAALDIGKAELVCCVRMPGPGNTRRRLQEVSKHSTMTRSLTELANHLVDLGIERLVMEAASDCWNPPAGLPSPAGQLHMHALQEAHPIFGLEDSAEWRAARFGSGRSSAPDRQWWARCFN